METKHTPGPWALDWNVARIDVFSADAATLVATVRRSTMSAGVDSTARTNARLIAAAPDLYDALRELLYAWDVLQDPAAGVAEDARAAIAQAVGK